MNYKKLLLLLLLLVGIITFTWKRSDFIPSKVDGHEFAKSEILIVSDDSTSDNMALAPGVSAAKAEVETTEAMAQRSLYGSEDESVKAILNSSNVNSRDEDGRTPLMILSFKRNLPAILALISAGADLNLTDESGQSALMSALDAQGQEVALALIKAGADVKHIDHSGQSTLNYAVSLGDIKVIESILAAGADPNHLSNKAGYSMLMNLSHEGQLESVALFLAAGAKIDGVDNEGNSVLHHAVYSSNEDVVQLILDSGAATDIKNRKGETPLQLARRLELVRIVSLISKR